MTAEEAADIMMIGAAVVAIRIIDGNDTETYRDFFKDFFL